MPFAFIMAVIFAALAIAAAVTWKIARPPQPVEGRYGAAGLETTSVKKPAGITALVLAGLAGLLVLISSWTQVSTQNVGIVTSFGRPVGHLSNGLHFIAPWDSSTELDGAVQTDSYYGQKNCILVRIARQQTACADASIRWRIEPAASTALFKNYHSFPAIKDSLVTRELGVAANQQFESYDPIASLTSKAPVGSPSNPSVIQIARQIKTQMQADLSGQVHVLSVLTPRLIYNRTVQDRINTVLQQAAQTDVARLAEQTALAQAQANRYLAASVSHDPGVLVSRCLDLVNESIKAAYTLPPGFSCFGASSVGVIANMGK